MAPCDHSRAARGRILTSTMTGARYTPKTRPGNSVAPLNRHLLGPGKPALSEWAALGLELPDIDAVREYRFGRVLQKLHELDYGELDPRSRRLSALHLEFHGVGLCDEYPAVFFPEDWEATGYDGVVELGMVLAVESYVGRKDGGEGVKLEEQLLVTENGSETLSTYPLELTKG
jgi:Xaa-Pro dipeptidase